MNEREPSGDRERRAAVRDRDLQASRREQEAYAQALALGTRIGFVVLLVTFLGYLLALLPPEVPVAELPRYWHLPVAQYVAATGAPTGWAWLAHLDSGDVLNFLGVAILALVTPLAYVRLLSLLLRERHKLLAAVCAAQIGVFALAVAGVFGHG